MRRRGSQRSGDKTGKAREFTLLKFFSQRGHFEHD
jgi:hypothetical protein